MKRTKLRRQGVQKVSVIQRKLWKLCKEIIRAKFPNVCYTCGRSGLSASNWHTGHLWPKVSLGAYLKYDIRVLRPQCYNCNINLGGNGAVFYKRMIEEHGQAYVDALERDRQITVKALDHYLLLIKSYEELLSPTKLN